MSCLITIENPNDAVFPGQAVVGMVFCTVATPEVIEVKIRVVGAENVVNPRSTNNVGNERQKIEFLKTEWIYIQSGRVDHGGHKFPFKVVLPRDIPSSYQRRCGNVKYFVKACLTTDSAEANDKMEFRVFSPIDLRELPDSALVPSLHSEGLVTQKWFCISELVKMDVKLEKIAFVVGEAMNIEVTVKNYSGLRVLAVSIGLYLRVAAKVPTPTSRYRTVCQLLCSGETPGGVAPYKGKIFTFQMTIPADTEIPNFQKCTLFAKKTTLEVTAMFSNRTSERTLKEEIELIIGHYPPDDKRGSLERMAGIRPPPYGMICGDSAKSSSSSLSTVMPMIRPASQNSSADRIPAPPYPVDVPLLSNQKTNIPYPYHPKQSYPPSPASNPPYPNKAPYPTESTCPYPTENPTRSRPHSTTSNSQNSSAERISAPPYPVDVPLLSNKKTNIPYPHHPKQSYPPCPADSPHYPKKAPYPTDSTCPYPTEDPTRSRPHSTTSNPVHTREESTSFHPPYPNTNSNSSSRVSTTNPPYPTEEVSNRTNAAPSPHRTKREVKDSPKPINMPSLPNRIDLPYPTTDSMPMAPPTLGSTAPYPTEEPPPPSTVGFEKFTRMPMPSDMSSVACGSIGFAVPTSVGVDAPHSTEDRPSAPLPPEEKTPPIATIDELEFIDDDNAEQEYPEVPSAPPAYEEVCQPPRRKKEGKKKERAPEPVPA